MFPGPLAHSLAGKALEEGKWAIDTIDPRDYSDNKHRNVDDASYGGGAGLVMRADILGLTIDAALAKKPTNRLIYFSPRGAPITQDKIRSYITDPAPLLLCGRFEAVDQRVLDYYAFEEVSLGDFVMSGGEIAALAVLDACVRLLPGVVENEAALQEESFGSGEYATLLEYPQYTRPPLWRDLAVPDILLSGNHQAIRTWRLEQALQITRERRPDL
jgi:tRNA (guanine37-N1)-methyltransferase